MEDFIKRLFIERYNLNRKLEKLLKFIKSDKFKSLPDDSQSDLNRQSLAMSEYLKILDNRLYKLHPGEVSEVGCDLGTALELLEEGYVLKRLGWNGKNLGICKQVPCDIGEEIIPNMQSLPVNAKKILMDTTKHIKYSNQLLIIDFVTGVANSWVPSSSDLFAKDYVILTSDKLN